MARHILTFNNLAEFMAAIKWRNTLDDGGGEHYGGMNTEQAMEYVLHGEQPDHVNYKRAEELVNKVDASFRDRESAEWQPSIQGAYPIVPEYLIGLPENMRTQCKVESDIAPIKLIMEPLVSQGVSNAELAQRAAALCALAMRMTETRPVELYVMGAMFSGRNKYGARTTETAYMVKLDCQPLNLAQTVAVFSTPFARRLSFDLHYTYTGAPARIRWGLVRQPNAMREAAIREAFNLEPQDVVIQGGYLPDAQLMHDNPVEWVHRQLDKQRTLED